MSYAIETKKRKFERILDSLTDTSSAQPRTSLNIRNNVSTASTLTSHSTDSSKRRRVTPIGRIQRVVTPSTASLTTHYLPSSRLAFLERLETFRQVTKWHIPSTSVINAVEWARRGWVCQDTDIVSCPNCKERLHIDIDLDIHASRPDAEIESEQDDTDEDDPVETANAVLQGLTKRYQDMIVTAHMEVCPWRRRGCDSSIQRIEGLLNVAAAISGLEKRYQSILEDDAEVPDVVSLPSTESSKVNEKELDTLQFSQQQTAMNINALRLSVCGWQKKEKDIVECRHCFRSLGLWLYRGLQPTIEHLDPIDSHLEYCPWRSESAQDTEMPVTTDEGESMKHKLPGWTLVYLAITKKNNKGRTHQSTKSYLQTGETEGDLQPQLSPEQREKKLKDIMKRIRDLKKPFNVKSLLKRKEK